MEGLLSYLIPGFLGFIGLALVWHGLDRMKKHRLIRDIPQSKVRSIAIGIVEVHGTVKTEAPIKTPFSDSDCVYYRYEIKEYRRHTSRDSKGRTSTTYRWDTIAFGSRHIPFYAEDDTGQIYVNPALAEFNVDVKKVFYQHAGVFGGITSLIETLKNWDANDEQHFDSSNLKLNPYVEKSGFVFRSSKVGDRKYYEYYLEPGENLFVIGTAANWDDAPNGICIQKGENQPAFIISNKTEEVLLKAMKRKMFAAFFFGIVFVVGGILLFMKFKNML
ncbi:MAG: GIDE domain-containing protein [Candidatus Zixiibacteriota bacterium]